MTAPSMLRSSRLTHLFAFNSSRVRLREELERFASEIPAGARVLDAGAGEAPYSYLFAHAIYESADFERIDKPYGATTYVCDLASIPVEDGRFDFVLFTQVMEHLPEPGLVLTELRRVLKVGGRLFYSGPLFYEEHEQPYDFYRYTQFALRGLFGAAGLEIERLDWLEGYFGTVAYQLHGMATHLPRRPSDLGGGLTGHALGTLLAGAKVVCGVSSIAFHHLETRLKYTSRGYPKNYVVIARKP